MLEWYIEPICDRCRSLRKALIYGRNLRASSLTALKCHVHMKYINWKVWNSLGACKCASDIMLFKKGHDCFWLANHTDWHRCHHLNSVSLYSVHFFMFMGWGRGNNWQSLLNVLNTKQYKSRNTGCGWRMEMPCKVLVLSLSSDVICLSMLNVRNARVELPITDHYLITNHFFRSSSSALHFEWFKMLSKRYLKI